MTEAIIFDMDGVLTDSEPIINAAAVGYFKERGVTVQPEDFHPFVGMGENKYIGGVAEKYGVVGDIDDMKHRTYEIYLDMLADMLTAFPGAVELVKACRAADLKVAVASSADLVKVAANLNGIGLPPEDFDAVVTAEKVEHKKPAPDIFLAAAKELGVAPEQCVVIEDAINGVEAALAANMTCIAVAQSFPAEDLQRAHLVREGIVDVSLDDVLKACP